MSTTRHASSKSAAKTATAKQPKPPILAGIAVTDDLSFDGNDAQIDALKEAVVAYHHLHQRTYQLTTLLQDCLDREVIRIDDLPDDYLALVTRLRDCQQAMVPLRTMVAACGQCGGVEFTSEDEGPREPITCTTCDAEYRRGRSLEGM